MIFQSPSALATSRKISSIKNFVFPYGFVKPFPTGWLSSTGSCSGGPAKNHGLFHLNIAPSTNKPCVFRNYAIIRAKQQPRRKTAMVNPTNLLNITSRARPMHRHADIYVGRYGDVADTSFFSRKMLGTRYGHVGARSLCF